jgi:tripartite-type tricarboxylate transporter receptor subunit TctC
MPYASFGIGSFSQIIMEALAKRSGAQFFQIPYRGSPQAIQELLADRVKLSFGGAVAEPFVQAGKLKRIAQVARYRRERPELPTFAEAGFVDRVFQTPVWTGILAPAGTPDPIVAKMRAAVLVGLGTLEMRASLKAEGATSIGSTPEEFRRDWRIEYDSIPPLIRELGITSE